jgi:predicted nucleotidyltransferase
MALNRYDATIEDYLANIVLTKSQTDIIDKELTSLSELFATNYEGDVEIYLQGSFATGTTVKPLTENQSENGAGEFDIDIVLERASWGDAVGSLEEIKEILLDSEEYSKKLVSENKNSCVRIEFSPDPDTGVVFHIDVTPIKLIEGQRLVSSRRERAWATSDPKKLVEWTNRVLADNPYAASQVLIIKRMRDVAGLNNSIVILALIGKKYEDAGSYAEDLIKLLEKIYAFLSTGIERIRLTNPINDKENIIQSWEVNPKIFDGVIKFFGSSLSTIRDGLNTENFTAIQQILSDDFPSQPLPTNVDSLRSEMITIATNGDFQRVKINSMAKFGKRVRTNLWLFFERSKAIHFVFLYPNNDDMILWQVCNSPGSEKLRGDLFRARALGDEPGTSTDKRVNNENELYLGKHWIRCFAINSSNQVIARGSKVYVQVMKNSAPSFRVPPRK